MPHPNLHPPLLPDQVQGLDGARSGSSPASRGSAGVWGLVLPRAWVSWWSRARRGALDTLGAGASLLCLVHCLAFPTLAALAPYAARQWGSWACCTAETSFGLHVLILLLATPVGVAAWVGGVRRHGRWGVALLGAVGIGLLALALTVSPEWFDGQGESLFTLAGSVLVAAAHLWNRDETTCCEHAAAHRHEPTAGEGEGESPAGVFCVQPAGESRRAA